MIGSESSSLMGSKRSNSRGSDAGSVGSSSDSIRITLQTSNETIRDGNKSRNVKDTNLSSPSLLKNNERTKKSSDSVSSFDRSIAVAIKSTPADPQLSKIKPVSGATTNYDDSVAWRSVADLAKKTDKLIDNNDPQNSSFNSSNSFFENIISSLSFKSNEDSRYKDQFRNSRSSLNKINQKTTESSLKYPNPMSIGRLMSEDISSVSSNDSYISKSRLPYNDRSLEAIHKYASSDENDYFHSQFLDISVNERLIEKFECTFTNEHTLKGKIYISEKHLCFHSITFSDPLRLIIPFSDTLSIENVLSGELHSNSILVVTNYDKYQFSELSSKAIVLELVRDIWLKVAEISTETSEMERLRRAISPTLLVERQQSFDPLFANKPYSELIHPSVPSSRRSHSSNNDAIIDNVIRSIDDGSLDNKETFSSDSSSTDGIERITNEILLEANEIQPQNGIRFKKGSNFSYNGPRVFHETHFPTKKHKNEFILCDTEFNVPPGILYELMFSENNTEFWPEFYKTQDISNFSKISKFDKKDNDGLSYREYNYIKGLHYPVGPKSTPCYVTDTIVHLDFENFIDIINVTKTPDVPSGNSFHTDTRYLFRWSSPTTCNLRISYWITWTASSWIKGMIESSCKSGQIDTATAIVPFIEDFIDKYTSIGMLTQEIEGGDRTIIAKSDLSMVQATDKNYYEELIKEQKEELVKLRREIKSKSRVIIVLLLLILSLFIAILVHEVLSHKLLQIIEDSIQLLNTK
ncbi:hypothetical protein Kpol_1023p14 [Vanderwaltozyma polyspora DSM 70294]|uniref:VASt domain-containing protein n=1 Tax=Vanderwaltozyma polyspora (strain ATCC 22028 / DSM 70294 / BCRC 21397 / CBS 2163 / NBRC 10782 / NRRL Y-8283 / UCD 57-17) TaxID=436907 RepID=A7TFN7_VANPO|nr:uncharacterized protein Kpol_1023p14 [Vanderwaltozyma polyspora DSM 70294]EDO18845.1 hypothetical protein Kpol_1023p14 [Vanderwaltozyma polyspora DSM 70294]